MRQLHVPMQIPVGLMPNRMGSDLMPAQGLFQSVQTLGMTGFCDSTGYISSDQDFSQGSFNSNHSGVDMSRPQPSSISRPFDFQSQCAFRPDQGQMMFGRKDSQTTGTTTAGGTAYSSQCSSPKGQSKRLPPKQSSGAFEYQHQPVKLMN